MSDLQVADGNRTTVGFVLIGIGLVFALDNAGLIHAGGIAVWWPLFLVGVGIVKLRQPREDGQRAAGAAFLSLGCLFLAVSLLATESSWPLLAVGIGVFLLWRGIAPPSEAGLVSEVPYLSDMVLIGHVRRRHDSPSFRGGSVTVIMGGIELDLRGAALPSGTASLDVVAFWGGIDIKVPAGWSVEGRVLPVMGAFENKLNAPSTPSGPRLIVRGHAIMGAVVIGS